MLDTRPKSLLEPDDTLRDNVDAKFVKYSSNGKDSGVHAVATD